MIDLNPNCSEATMRVRTDNLNNKEEEELYRYLLLLDKYADEDNIEEYDWWYDTYIETASLGSVSWIEIRGDAPFNSEEKILEYLYKLPFAKKLEIGY